MYGTPHCPCPPNYRSCPTPATYVVYTALLLDKGPQGKRTIQKVPKNFFIILVASGSPPWDPISWLWSLILKFAPLVLFARLEGTSIPNFGKIGVVLLLFWVRVLSCKFSRMKPPVGNCHSSADMQKIWGWSALKIHCASPTKS